MGIVVFGDFALVKFFLRGFNIFIFFEWYFNQYENKKYFFWKECLLIIKIKKKIKLSKFFWANCKLGFFNEI